VRLCGCLLQLQLGLTLVSLVGKLAYSYDLGAWGFLEGMMNARNHPNILFWNITRFNPFYCMLEVRLASRKPQDRMSPWRTCVV
jgi:hypothetical protein